MSPLDDLLAPPPSRSWGVSGEGRWSEPGPNSTSPIVRMEAVWTPVVERAGYFVKQKSKPRGMMSKIRANLRKGAGRTLSE